MAHIGVAGTDLYYERTGRGAPLLLIMGMGGTTSLWGDELIGPLAEQRDVIVYDHRGAGRSGRVTDPFSTADLAQDALGLLTALDVASAHVLGISMGGMVAQEIALAAPERVESLALGCTWAGGTHAIPPTQSDAQEFFGLTQERDPQRLLERSFRLNVSEHFAADPSNLARFMARSMHHPTPRATVAVQVGAISTHTTGDRLAALDVPTLVLHGSDDRLIPAANGTFLAQTIRRARHRTFEDVGHLFWSERPAETADALLTHTEAAAAHRSAGV